jgi:hypothetical protein
LGANTFLPKSLVPRTAADVTSESGDCQCFSGIEDNSLRKFTSVVSGKGEWRERHLIANVSVNKNLVDKRELTILLQDPASAMRHLLEVWSDVPLLLMLDVDWERGPLVLIGTSDRMMWPLLPPGSLLQLNPKIKTVATGSWSEFERPIYLIESRGRFFCCHAQRRGEMLRLISHGESPSPPAISVPFKEAKVRGQLKPIFRPLATRGSPVGRPQRGRNILGR